MSYCEDDMSPLLVDLSVFSGMIPVTDTPTRREDKNAQEIQNLNLDKGAELLPPSFLTKQSQCLNRF